MCEPVADFGALNHVLKSKKEKGSIVGCLELLHCTTMTERDIREYVKRRVQGQEVKMHSFL